MSELLTVEDVANICKVKPVTVRNWVTNEFIEFIKLPQGIRFRKEYIEKWLEKRTIKANKKVA